MQKLDKTYQELLQDILDNGYTKKDRTGTGTISVFGRTIRHKMSDGFPLLTTKKMYFKGIVTELLWFLRGDTNIKYLVDNDCNIWTSDAYKNYIKLSNKYSVLKPPYYFDYNYIKIIGKLEDNNTKIYQYTKEEFIERIKTDSEFANRFGNLGKIYGYQWRNWERYGYRGVQNGLFDCGLISEEDLKKEMNIDQISILINELKNNPDSRRLMVSAWNVGDLSDMILPPCHYSFQVYTRELSEEEYKKLWNENYEKLDKGDHDQLSAMFETDNITPTRAISLMWNQRSVDTFLGLPFNIASYGLLLEIIAKMVNMVPDELIGNLGDTHLYLNHIEQAEEQIIRKSYELPTLKHIKTNDFYESLSKDLSLLTHLDSNDFIIENYQSHPTIKAQLSN